MIDRAGSMAGRCCVITGATSGIGRATASALAKTGCDLVLTGRRESLGTPLAADLQRRPGAGRVSFIPADLSDLQQVRSLAAAVRAKAPRLDVLINNAGARYDHYQTSRDGVELTFATNHLGHFLLTALLLETLLAGQQPQVITLASSAHAGAHAPGSWNPPPAQYDRKLAYAQSKLANLLFSIELARRLIHTKLVSHAVDPGGVATHLGRNNGLWSWFRHLAYYTLKRELLTPRQGAETVVFLACSAPRERVSGKYFYRKSVIAPSAVAQDAAVAARLWTQSIELAKLDQSVGAGWHWLAPQ